MTSAGPRPAESILDQYFLEMRWRCLSLAADLDRIDRSPGGDQLIRKDPRLARLRQALSVLLDDDGERAERVQAIFSDRTPPPER